MGRTIKLGCLNMAVWDFVIVTAIAGYLTNRNYNLHPFYCLLVGCAAGVLLLLLMRIRFLGSLLQIACGLIWSQAIWRVGIYFHPTDDPIWYWGMQGFLAVVCVILHFLSVHALLGPKKDYSHKTIDTTEVADRYMAIDLMDDPEEIQERFYQLKEDFLDACEERDEVMALAQEILDEDDSPDTDDLYRLMMENDRIWTEGTVKMGVYVDMIRDARNYQEQKQAINRAEKLLTNMERITYEVMRETNRVMALEKDLYLEDEYYDEQDNFEEDEDVNEQSEYTGGSGYSTESEYTKEAKTAYEEYQRRTQSNQQSESQYRQQENAQSGQTSGAQSGGDIDQSLFAGCKDKDSLTKRYRALMKTFHPDNQDGDTEMTIKVQKTYDYMMKQLG